MRPFTNSLCSTITAAISAELIIANNATAESQPGPRTAKPKKRRAISLSGTLPQHGSQTPRAGVPPNHGLKVNDQPAG
jgi:hypothetical protein